MICRSPGETGITRRIFLQSTGLSALALGLSTGASAAFSDKLPISDDSAFSYTVPTVCSMCRARCHVLATVRNGRLIKMEGNPASTFNGRKICARGQAAVKLLYDPDRLKFPLKRVGEKGEGKWKRISWQEALGTIAAEFKKSLVVDGPDSLALFAGGASSYYIKQLYQKNNINQIYDASNRHCQDIADLAYNATFGFDAKTRLAVDYSHSRCIVFIGSHVGENIQVPALQQILSALERGAEIIVADPRYSSIAAKSGFYLPVKPGTDTALLLGWLHHIVFANLYDQQWVSQNTSGFDEFKEHLRQYPLNRVSALTGISEDDIRKTAEVMIRNAPATVVHSGGHQSWYGNDVQRVRAQALLMVMLGAVGNRGGLEMFKYPDLPEELVDFVPNSYMGHGSSFSSLMNGMLSGKIKMVGCWGQNPLQNHPAPYKTIEAFKKANFVFCSDVLPGEASLYADIVLPESTFLERYDVLEIFHDMDKSYVASRFPVVEPLFESKDPYWIVKRLNDQIGRNRFFSHGDIVSFLDRKLLTLGSSLAGLKSGSGMVELPDHCGGGQLSPLPNSDITPDLFMQGDLAEKPQFPTPSGRIELYSSSLAEQGWAPLPEFEQVEEPPAGYARLLYGRSPVHSLTFTLNNPWLNHEMAENELWVNSNYAARLGVSDNDQVYLENQDGIRSLKPVKVKVTVGIRMDCVYMAHGFGCRSTAMRHAFNRGVSDTWLMTRSREDRISGVRGMRVNFVRFVKVS